MGPDLRTSEVWQIDVSPPSAKSSCKEDYQSLATQFCPQQQVGGELQCKFTLLQTAIGAGMLILPAAMKMTGLAVGLLLLAFNGVVVYLGLDTMMRGAIRLQVKDTAALLAKCLGKWSGPAMELLLALYGNGQVITFFVRLGDFLPIVARHLMALGWMP